MTINRSTLNASLHGLTAVGVSLLLASCASSTPAAPAKASAPATASINDLCPITGDTSDPRFSAAYKGRTIAFCCENCLREFRETDEAGRAAIAAKVRP